MVQFLSSYNNSAGNSSFSARVLGHTEDIKGIITLHVASLSLNATTWGAMASLRTWKYNVREIPGAANLSAAFDIQILGGPGFGSLNIDSYNSWTAMLTDMQLERVHLPTGYIFGHLSFLVQP